MILLDLLRLLEQNCQPLNLFISCYKSVLLFKSCFVHTDPWYLEVGKSMAKSLTMYTKVKGGFASVRDVTTMELEDHQHSFFLAETYDCTLFLQHGKVYPFVLF